MPTERESQILKLIQENPLITQKELAQRLGITRPGVASHISRLIKAGLISGKGYVLPAEKIRHRYWCDQYGCIRNSEKRCISS